MAFDKAPKGVTEIYYEIQDSKGDVIKVLAIKATGRNWPAILKDANRQAHNYMRQLVLRRV